MTFILRVGSAKKNQHAKYPGQRLFGQKYQ